MEWHRSRMQVEICGQKLKKIKEKDFIRQVLQSEQDILITKFKWLVSIESATFPK